MHALYIHMYDTLYTVIYNMFERHTKCSACHNEYNIQLCTYKVYIGHTIGSYINKLMINLYIKYSLIVQTT